MNSITQEKIDAALVLIQKSGANCEYFFSKLESPEWIIPLNERGFFKNPPPKIIDQRGVGFPFWPESKYLARMASRVPQLVMEIILKAQPTENNRVHEDFVEAATQMPANIAKKIIPKAKEWLKAEYKLLLPEKIGKLIVHLAKAGESTASLDLARTLLQLQPRNEISGQETGEDPRYNPPPEAVGLVEEYEYESILEEITATLLKADPVGTLTLYCKLLTDAMRMSVREEEVGDREDYSYIWRQSIEGDENNYSNRFANLLVTKLRIAGEFIGTNSPQELSALMEILFQKEWPIFWRIGLYMLRKFPTGLEPQIQAKLTDRKLFELHTVRYEYFQLSREHFKNLSEDHKLIILGWIDQGPDVGSYRENLFEWYGREATDEEIENLIKVWRRDRLAPLVDGLPDQWIIRWQSLLAEIGEPNKPELVYESSATWIGPTSPKSENDLLSMPITELIGFLKNWMPAEGVHESTPEGLGRILTDAIKIDPAKYAETATEFSEIDPTYVRSLIFGLRQAGENKKEFPWLPVIELILNILRYPREIPGRKVRRMDADPDWGWTRREVAQLLTQGLSQSGNPIPIHLRTKVWSIISILTTDPEPTPDFEREYGGGNMDPATLSINTVRGAAMHTVIRYALWYKRRMAESTMQPDKAILLSEMPEVREVLELHLNPRNDPAFSIRSIYGQWFPPLVYIDEKWASEKAPFIFPLEKELEPFFQSSWNTYLQFSRPYDNVFEILRTQYRWAVSQLSSREEEKQLRSHRDSRRELAEHLMIYYGRGRFDLNDELLIEFWEKAPIEISIHAIEFIGRNLQQTNEVIPKDTLLRLQRLIETRLTDIKLDRTETRNKELKGFGWWFASNRFDNSWSISILKQILERNEGNIEGDHEVIKKLAELSTDMTAITLDCLRQMVEGHTEQWGTLLWRDSMRIILINGLKSSSDTVKTSTVDFIHFLGGKGYSEFRDLLIK